MVIILSIDLECKVITWDEVYNMCKRLARLIEKSGFKPDTIIGLARSGFVPSRLLSDFMGVTDLVSLKVEHWLDTTAEHKENATIPYKVPLNIAGRNVLIADDIVDTGKSMLVTIDYVRQYKPKTLRTAVMQYVKSAQYVPDYYAVSVSRWAWFIYPWNFTEDVCNLTVRLLKASNCRSLDDIRAGLKEKLNIALDTKQMREIITILRKRGKITRLKNGWKPI